MLMRRAATGAATTGGGDSRDRDDVLRQLGAAGGGWGRLAERGEGSGGGDGRVALGLSPFFLSLEIRTLVFFLLRALQVKPQEHKELCGGREGQTVYYVERKALHCGACCHVSFPRGSSMLNDGHVPWSSSLA